MIYVEDCAIMAKKMQHRFADAALLLPLCTTSTISTYKCQNDNILKNYDTKIGVLYNIVGLPQYSGYAFTFSHKYECDETDLSVMKQSKWSCWSAPSLSGSKCGFAYCPSYRDPDNYEDFQIGDAGHDYLGVSKYDQLIIQDVVCKTENPSCDYVRVEYYDQDSFSEWSGHTIPIVTNLCINIKIFGCNETNYWRIDYFDNDCTQPASLYFYELQTDIYPKISVCLCCTFLYVYFDNDF